MEQVCFFMMHREGWAKQMKTRTVHIIGRYFLPPRAHFGLLQSSDARIAVSVWPAWGNFYNEIHLGAPSLCALSSGEQDCVIDNPFKMGHEWWMWFVREHFEFISMTRGDWYLTSWFNPRCASIKWWSWAAVGSGNPPSLCSLLPGRSLRSTTPL